MSLLSVIVLCLLVGVIIAGLWVDYQCNWKRKPTELRGFDVVVPKEVEPPLPVIPESADRRDSRP